MAGPQIRGNSVTTLQQMHRGNDCGTGEVPDFRVGLDCYIFVTTLILHESPASL